MGPTAQGTTENPIGVTPTQITEPQVAVSASAAPGLVINDRSIETGNAAPQAEPFPAATPFTASPDVTPSPVVVGAPLTDSTPASVIPAQREASETVLASAQPAALDTTIETGDSQGVSDQIPQPGVTLPPPVQPLPEIKPDPTQVADATFVTEPTQPSAAVEPATELTAADSPASTEMSEANIDGTPTLNTGDADALAALQIPDAGIVPGAQTIPDAPANPGQPVVIDSSAITPQAEAIAQAWGSQTTLDSDQANSGNQAQAEDATPSPEVGIPIELQKKLAGAIMSSEYILAQAAKSSDPKIVEMGPDIVRGALQDTLTNIMTDAAGVKTQDSNQANSASTSQNFPQ